MNYELSEASIIERLVPFKTAGIELQALPEKLSDFQRPFTRGRIIVGYKGSKWAEKIKSAGHSTQDEEVIWEITFQSRFLRGDFGIYTLMSTAIRALVGFAPENCDKMYCKEGGMTGVATLEEGVWTYSLLMACSNINVEDFEEDLTVIFSRFTNKEAFCGEETGHTFDTPSGVFTVPPPVEENP